MSKQRLLILSVFLLLIAIWTTTPTAIKKSTTTLPLLSLTLRLSIGLLFCYSYMLLTKQPLHFTKKDWQIYIITAVTTTGSMTALYYGSQLLPTGWIAILFALSPLITGVFSFICNVGAPLNTRKILGIFCGITGLYFIFSSGLSMQGKVGYGIVLLLIAVHFSAIGTVALKALIQKQNISAMQISTGGLLLTVPTLLISSFFIEIVAQDITIIQAIGQFGVNHAGWFILYLGIFGSGIGFTLYFYLLKKLAPSTVTLTALITPITTLIFGAVVNQEYIDTKVWLGCIAVCGGLLLYEYKPRFGLKKI